MNGVLIAFELVLLLPLFVGTWRVSLFGLSCQGLLMTWIALRQGGQLSTDGIVIDVVDLALLRAVVAPTLLYAVLHKQGAPPRNDVIAPNLLSWVVALTLVMMAFRLADVMVPTEGEDQALVAVAASALLLGLLVLATGRGTLSQMIGVLRLENAIGLFELGGAFDHESMGIRIGKTAVSFFSVFLFGWYLLRLGADTPASPEEAVL